MTYYICRRCGTQFAQTAAPPSRCPICEDERQYLGPKGQEWTSLVELAVTSRNIIRDIEPGIWGVATEPSFAIGQRAMLIRTPAGNVLWDCISYIDNETVRQVNSRGGIAAIAISHPHYYASVVEWSRRFGGAPVYLHASDAEWIMRPDPCIVPWDGEQTTILPGVTLVNVGGHFPGSTVLHWADGADCRGTLHTGDSITVGQDRRRVSFMYSYPNLIPLSPGAVTRIVDALAPFSFERIYAAWWDTVVRSGGKGVLESSARRYIEAVTGAGVTSR